MNLNDIIQKIPKPILVGGVLILALIFFIYNDPLRDECDVQVKIFQRNTQGILTAVRTKTKKVQFAQINYSRDSCVEGNSQGACENYFNNLKLLTSQFKDFSVKCQKKYAEQSPDFLLNMRKAMSAMSLLAWGEKPPEGVAYRLGWLTESDLKTFCAIRDNYVQVDGEEKYLEFRNEVYKAFPDKWSDKVPLEARIPDDRPKAFKTSDNPVGSLDKSKIYERSLFSIRCDLYM